MRDYDSSMVRLARMGLAVLLASGLAAPALAQRVLDLPQSFAFTPAEVGAFAGHAYGARLRTLRDASRVDGDDALKARLQRLFPRIAAAAAYEMPASASLAWEIHSCAGCDENAAALPGGKLLVSSDLVARLALSDDELAYLLAHEVAHVIAQHTREYASAARYMIDNGRHRSYADIQEELDASLSAMVRMAPIAAAQELEADRIGFVLGAHAGFAPAAMLSLLGKLGDGAGFAGSHPPRATRFAQARQMLDAARRLAARPITQSQP